jgi:O-antigen/teichoic acid export membrane protein
VSRATDAAIWGADDRTFERVARNVATRYLAIVVDGLLGLVVLPFNVRHLGPSAYGLWMLTASVTVYFSLLDLGFGGSMTKFVAHCRARRDARSLNEIVSTLFVVFALLGTVAYAVFVAIAFNIEHLFNLSPQQVPTARTLMLIIGVYVSLTFPASIFGGIMNGFQRYDLNTVVGIASSMAVAAVNVAMLMAGCTLVTVVLATTSIRVAAYVVYRWNAYSVFPLLSIRPALFRWSRLRELTSFSLYVSILDWASKLNYAVDAIVIGAFLSSAAVAVWTVPQRIAEILQRLTNQVNSVLFPVIVDSDAGSRSDRLREVFLHGTLVSLVTVVPLTAVTFMLAGPLITGWVGTGFHEAVPVAQILMLVVAIRVGNATATTVLKGAGRHRFLALATFSMALTNLGLSLLWIRRFGLVGQAMGTLVPIAIGSLFVLWPAACRRVDIDVATAVRTAVWPAVWPVAAPVALLALVRDRIPLGLAAVAAAGAAAVACYLITFLALAVKSEQRRRYLVRAAELIRARGTVAAAA